MWPTAITPADSARAAAHVYSLSLIACLPVALATLAMIAWRSAPGAHRALLWRSAILTLLFVYVGRALPTHWLAVSIPGVLAAPLVALGRLQLSMSGTGSHGASWTWPVPLYIVQALLVAYWVGVAVALLRVARDVVVRQRRARRATDLTSPEWRALLRRTMRSAGVQGALRLKVSDAPIVPQTFGWWRPTILLPAEARRWTRARRRTVLLHELAHVRRRDSATFVVSSIACALYWFHPAVWYAARRFRDASERACDDRVLASGIRASDYATVLLDAASRRREPTRAPAFGRATGLRGRLAAIVGPACDRRDVSRRVATAAIAGTLLVALPLSTVRLAPTRGLLTGLMRDARWDVRAYAVAGLSQRRDSVDVARTAARLDPNPRVRALARYALAQPASRDLPAILSVPGL